MIYNIIINIIYKNIVRNIKNISVADEEDVFQCGKCRSQFTNLSMFVSHKQQMCRNSIVVPEQQQPTIQNYVSAQVGLFTYIIYITWVVLFFLNYFYCVM